MTDELRVALQQAVDDLGIEVQLTGFALQAGDSHYACVGLVRDFGTPKGMVIFDPAQYTASAAEAAQEGGYGYSTLGAAYDHYDRRLYVAMLNDWGWFGSGQRPDWYTGDTGE